MKPKSITLSQFYLPFDVEHLHLQPLLEYLHHRQTELSLPLVYLLEGHLFIIKIKFRQGLNLEVHHV